MPTANIKLNYKHDILGLDKRFAKGNWPNCTTPDPNKTAIYTITAYEISPLKNLASKKHVLPECEFS